MDLRQRSPSKRRDMAAGSLSPSLGLSPSPMPQWNPRNEPKTTWKDIYQMMSLLTGMIYFFYHTHNLVSDVHREALMLDVDPLRLIIKLGSGVILVFFQAIIQTMIAPLVWIYLFFNCMVYLKCLNNGDYDIMWKTRAPFFSIDFDKCDF